MVLRYTLSLKPQSLPLYQTGQYMLLLCWQKRKTACVSCGLEFFFFFFGSFYIFSLKNLRLGVSNFFVSLAQILRSFLGCHKGAVIPSRCCPGVCTVCVQ